MKTSISGNGYPIYFEDNGYDLLNELIEKQKYSTIFILVDTGSNEHCLPLFLPLLETDIPIEIIEMESGETSKNIETCVLIWEALTSLGADRKSLLINLGGGVVTDIGGFVAATFKRGIDFVHIPTTLLGMVDAAVGGKNGVDLGVLKNQIGLLTVPMMLLIDPLYLSTLPKNEMRSGLAEMLKHGLIFDEQYWNKFLQLHDLTQEDLNELIYESVVIKNRIVTQDPTENGIRKALNFGHTLGHAIESYFLEHPGKQALLHGEAVAAGMILESYISWQKNLLSEESFHQIKYVIGEYFERISFDEQDIAAIQELLVHDKKNEYGIIQFALLNGIGQIIINQNAEKELITSAFLNYKT